MSDRLAVVCLNAHDYLGRGAEYVGKLERAVKRNLTLPHDFVCLTEHDFDGDKRGWWLKLDLIQKSYGSWVLYLDLDVVITSNIDHLVEYARQDPNRVWMRDDFSYSIVRPRREIDPHTRRLLGGPGCCNSSVMLFYDTVPLEFPDEWLTEMHGDQNVISAALWPGRIGLFPDDSVKSYKYHPGQIAPIVVFHGQPKPHEVADEWVRKHWSL